ncbi:hypothetical protein OFM36_30175, partial [Escherichia coli]|nr:hypothetical protein [Escherichia coli]
FANLLEKNSGHQTDSPLENGGWIYQRKNGALFFLRADNAVRMGGSPAMRYRNAIDLSRPPSIKETRVVGKVHTHPYTPYEQELISSGQSYGGPSSIDMLNSAKE